MKQIILGVLLMISLPALSQHIDLDSNEVKMYHMDTSFLYEERGKPKFFEKGDLLSYSLSALDGALNGFNQGIYHYPKGNGFFNPYRDGWELDADHISNALRVSVISLNIVVSMNDFQKGDSWKRYPKRFLGCLLAHQLLMITTHNLMR